MAEATSITLERIRTEGERTQYELKSTASSAETVTIPTTASQITTSSNVIPISAWDVSSGVAITTLAYSSASRQFTVTRTGMTDNDVRIVFDVE